MDSSGILVTNEKITWPDQMRTAGTDRKQTKMPTYPRSRVPTHTCTDRNHSSHPSDAHHSIHHITQRLHRVWASSWRQHVSGTTETTVTTSASHIALCKGRKGARKKHGPDLACTGNCSPQGPTKNTRSPISPCGA